MNDSFALLVYASSAASRTFCNNYFRFRRIYSVCTNEKSDCYELWQQHKQLKSMEIRMRSDLIFTMRDTYINVNLGPLTKFTTSSRNTEFKDILPWNISKIIMKTIPISRRIVIRYAMKWDIPCWVCWKVKETETRTRLEVFNGGKGNVEQILVSKERNI